MRNREYLLCALLDCGYADLAMLDDVGYDINDIIEEARLMFGDICLNSIMAVIFQKGLSDLEVAFADNQNRIIDEIDEEIKQIKNDYKNDCLKDIDYVKDKDYVNCLKDEVYALERPRMDLVDFHPVYDGSYFINYLDSHIYICLILNFIENIWVMKWQRLKMI